MFSQNQPPEISNFNLTLTGDETLTIQYDLFDFENDNVTISLHVKNSEGNTFSIDTQSATGDLNIVTPGTGKSIEWNFTGKITSSADYIVKLVAEDMGAIDIQAIVNQVDQNKLIADLDYIEGVRNRTTGTAQLQLTRDFIEQRFADYGLSFAFQDVPYFGYTGKNLIGTKTGTTDDEFVYICDAHYDSVDGSPGADDNGSGVVGFLEVARILSQYNFKKTIKFIGFDLEEDLYIGSTAYVQDKISTEEEIVGVLNHEMIGYYSDVAGSQTLPAGFDSLFPDAYAEIANDGFRGNFIGNFGLTKHSAWPLAYDSAAATYVPDLSVITFLAPDNWEAVAPDLGRSDHSPFWRNNHPAVMLTGTSNFRNANLHQPSDTSSTLNFTFMSNVVKAAVATLAVQAEIHNSNFEEEIINITTLSINKYKLCKFTVKPNPVNDTLNLNTSNCNSNYSRVSIYDLNGKLVFKKEISELDNALDINVIDWPNGVYLLKIKGSEIVKKIIVQH